MSHAIFLEAPGDVSQLSWREAPRAALKPGEVRIKHTAIGVNFIDIYHRSGLYPLPEYPAILGMEGAGVVEETGQRVAYVSHMPGAYAEERVLPEEALIKLPKNISDDTAAALMLKGLTAHYLLRKTYPVKAGETILVHAAAGGVGLLLCQWARHLGATVIGTVGDETKAKLARENGAHHTILYRRENIVERVREITGGKGVSVVYDGVGADTFAASLDCLRPRGMMVSFGQASGKIPPMDTSILAQKGSLFLTRPVLFHYIADRQEYEQAAAELFDLLEKKILAARIDRTIALKDATLAHQALEARETQGAIVLKP